MEKEYSKKTKRILKKADAFLYESRKHLGKVKGLVERVNNAIISDEAEGIANSYQKQKTI